LKVCFLGGGISAALCGELLGGAEKQQALIINGLKENGVDVIVIEYHLKEHINVNGVDIYPSWHKGRKSVRKKLTDLFNQVKERKINIIYSRGTDMYAAILYFLLKLTGSKIKLFWGIAGDHDLTSKYNYLRVNYARSIYAKLNAGLVFNLSSFFLLKFSDGIICQTEWQVEKCKARSKKKSISLITNIYSKNIDKIEPGNETQTRAIWIGKFSGNKGEDTLLKIAKDIPQQKITCLGHVTEDFKTTETYVEITKQNNLILKGRVKAHEVPFYIANSDYILNTSPSEGLSNVFLEAWDKEKPVISYIVNPNQYLTTGEAGYCAHGSYTKLISLLREIEKDTVFLKYHGRKGKEILDKHHKPEVIIPKYIQVFGV
jgi:hypothetical protein